MMPRWLRLWLALTLLCVWGIALLVLVPFLVTQVVKSGEPAFDREQTSYLKENYPGGSFTTASTYRWCDGRVFIYFDSRGDVYNYGQQCWRIDR